jgi:hypothetical protein
MPTQSILVEYGTYIVLTSRPFYAPIVFLAECLDATIPLHGVNYPNYAQTYPLAQLKPEAYVEWTWNQKGRKFEETKKDLITERVRTRSLVATKKAEAIGIVMASLSRARYAYSSGVLFQETVYLAKELQARAFMDSGYDEAHIMEYPYVIQYADYAGISLKQAADDILFKAKLDTDGLTKTEFLRLKYFNLIKRAEVAGLPEIRRQFMLDCNIPQIT